MVWKEIKQNTAEKVEYLTKKAKKLKENPLFSHAHTREGKPRLNKFVPKLTKEIKVDKRKLNRRFENLRKNAVTKK